jgi:hypothetical protein
MDMSSLFFIAEMCGDRIVAENGCGGKRICHSPLNIHGLTSLKTLSVACGVDLLFGG